MLVQISNYWAKIILFDGFLLILQRFLKIIKYHMRKYYIVAEHGFSVEAEESIFSFMTQYEPFLADKSTSKEVFNLHIHQTQKPIENFIEDYRQNEEDYTILFGHTTDEEYVGFGRHVVNNLHAKLIATDFEEVCDFGQFEVEEDAVFF